MYIYIRMCIYIWENIVSLPDGITEISMIHLKYLSRILSPNGIIPAAAWEAARYSDSQRSSTVAVEKRI
jgi:hypothetical protein